MIGDFVDRDKDAIERYFKECVNFWMKEYSVSPEVAVCRTLWWDCAEAWNNDRSWNEDKIKFFNRYRKYEPYGPLPEYSVVEKGNA